MCKTLERSIALVVLGLQLDGNLHAAVDDEVVNHLQPDKEWIRTKIDPYLVENFLVLGSCGAGQPDFFVVFLSAGQDFNKNAKGSQRGEDCGA